MKRSQLKLFNAVMPLPVSSSTLSNSFLAAATYILYLNLAVTVFTSLLLVWFKSFFYWAIGDFVTFVFAIWPISKPSKINTIYFLWHQLLLTG